MFFRLQPPRYSVVQHMLTTIQPDRKGMPSQLGWRVTHSWPPPHQTQLLKHILKHPWMHSTTSVAHFSHQAPELVHPQHQVCHKSLVAKPCGCAHLAGLATTHKGGPAAMPWWAGCPPTHKGSQVPVSLASHASGCVMKPSRLVWQLLPVSGHPCQNQGCELGGTRCQGLWW